MLRPRARSAPLRRRGRGEARGRALVVATTLSSGVGAAAAPGAQVARRRRRRRRAFAGAIGDVDADRAVARGDDGVEARPAERREIAGRHEGPAQHREHRPDRAHGPRRGRPRTPAGSWERRIPRGAQGAVARAARRAADRADRAARPRHRVRARGSTARPVQRGEVGGDDGGAVATATQPPQPPRVASGEGIDWGCGAGRVPRGGRRQAGRSESEEACREKKSRGDRPSWFSERVGETRRAGVDRRRRSEGFLWPALGRRRVAPRLRRIGPRRPTSRWTPRRLRIGRGRGRGAGVARGRFARLRLRGARALASLGAAAAVVLVEARALEHDPRRLDHLGDLAAAAPGASSAGSSLIDCQISNSSPHLAHS